MVWGPTSSTNLLIRRVLAKVPGIKKYTSGHDLVVTSSGSVGVEVLLLDVLVGEETGGGGVLGNRTGRGDVVGGDGVSEIEETVGSFDVLDGDGFGLEGLEERGVVDVG